ncbi:MAG TPA: hypothetical protein VHD14_00560 [Pseudolabrys sp.]|nr:hypothetical protein [Pseudolabrys sp.]
MTAKHVTAAELGRHLGLSRVRVGQLAEYGTLKRSPSGRFDQDACRLAYIGFLRAQRRGDGRSPGRGRLDAAKAKQIEIAIAREERRLIKMDEALGFVDELVGGLRSDFQGLGARVTRDLPMIRKIDAEVDGIFNRTADKYQAEAAALRAGKAG